MRSHAARAVSQVVLRDGPMRSAILDALPRFGHDYYLGVRLGIAEGMLSRFAQDQIAHTSRQYAITAIRDAKGDVTALNAAGVKLPPAGRHGLPQVSICPAGVLLPSAVRFRTTKGS